MPSANSDRYALLDRLAEEFADRYRRGERPALAEYTDRYPELADDIRELFPAMAEVEQAEVDRHAPETAPDPEIPTLKQIGDYRILREVGRGGMGVVYEAEQVSLGRRVALKVLPQAVSASERQRRRFEREAKAAAKLHHSNIVPVFGVGEYDGTLYYVMQFIQGSGLDEVVEELRRLQPGALTATMPDPVSRSGRSASAADVARSLMTGHRDPSESEPTVALASGWHEDQPGDLPAEPGPGHAVAASPSPSSAILAGRPGDSGSARHRKLTYWQGVARIGSQVADALEYAHKQGVLHRDVKPSNLLLDTRGTVWVTDFGLAKTEGQQNLTDTGDILGTLRYMPPEAFEGHADARSEVYALGLTLYEMLALRPAFGESERNRLIKQVTTSEPARLNKLNPAVPRDLVTVIHKAIDREPTRRYQTAGDFAEDLRRFLDDEPIKARRLGVAERFGRWCRRNPLPASLTAAVVTVFMLGFAGVLWQWREAEAARRDVENLHGGLVNARTELAEETERVKQAQELAKQEEARGDEARRRTKDWEARAEVIQDEAEATSYRAAIARATLEGQANNFTEARNILHGCPPDRRGWEWHYLSGLFNADLFTLRGHSGWAFGVAYSPDGKLIASAGGGNAYFETQGPESVRDGEIIIWDAETGELRHTLTGHEHLVAGVAFSPDGKRLASYSPDGTVRFWDVAGGKEVGKITPPADPICVAFSPDGKLLVAGCSDLVVRVWDVESRRELEPLLGATKIVGGLAFSPDGKTLVTNSHAAFTGEGRVRVWDFPSRTELPALESNVTLPDDLAVSPDGRHLAASHGGSIKYWDLTTGKLLRTIRTGHLGKIWALAFAPDGRTFATGSEDATIRVWDALSGAEVHLFRGHGLMVRSVAYSPDGDRLVSGSADGTVKVWDLTVHPEHPSIRTGGLFKWDLVEALGFGEDGRSLTIVSRTRAGLVRFDAEDHTLLGYGTMDITDEWRSPAESACLDPGGRCLACVTRGEPKVVKCWDTLTGKERVALHGHTMSVWHVSVSLGGRRIATGTPGPRSGDGLGELKVWDGNTGEPLFEFAEEGFGVQRVALSPSGDRLAVSGYRTRAGDDGRLLLYPFITVYDVDAREELRTFRGVELWDGLAFSGDGRRLAACGGFNQITLLWDLGADGQPTLKRNAPAGAADVAFSPDPDGTRLAVAGRLAQKILDAETGEELLVLRGPSQRSRGTSGYASRVRWSPDGERLAATCGGSVTVWSAYGDAPEVRAARRRGADRRGTAHHLLTARALAAGGSPAARFHLDRVAGRELNGGWEYALRGLVYAELGEAEKAEEDYARAVGLAPDDPWIDYCFGEAYAKNGRWQRAAPHFERYAASDRVEPWYFCKTLCLPLYLNDPETHRRQCERAVEFTGGVDDPNERRAVLMWGPLAGNVCDAGQLLRMIEGCMHGNEDHRFYDHMVLARGIAEYRAGNTEAAVEWLSRGERMLTKINKDVLIQLFLAMAYHRQDKGDNARTAYETAMSGLERHFGSRDEYQPGEGPWEAWVLCNVIRREAEGLIGVE